MIRREQAWKRFVIVPVVVLAVIGCFLLLGYLAALALRVPLYLGLSAGARLLGAGLLVVAFGLWAWLFRCRKPADVLTSTYLTFSRAFQKVELAQDLGRTEPLVVKGPYKLVRHPIYLAVLVSLVGWGVLMDLSFILLATPFALAWFYLVVMPFEEKELLALFGRDYEEYMKRVRRIVPIPRHP